MGAVPRGRERAEPPAQLRATRGQTRTPLKLCSPPSRGNWTISEEMGELTEKPAKPRCKEEGQVPGFPSPGPPSPPCPSRSPPRLPPAGRGCWRSPGSRRAVSAASCWGEVRPLFHSLAALGEVVLLPLHLVGAYRSFFLHPIRCNIPRESFRAAAIPRV